MSYVIDTILDRYTAGPFLTAPSGAQIASHDKGNPSTAPKPLKVPVILEITLGRGSERVGTNCGS